jgi:amino acid transporter
MIASVTAGKGILMSVIATGLLGFPTVILLLFCTPDLDTALALDAPQPFVQIYSLALGKGGSIVMTVVAVIDLIMVCLFHIYDKKENSDGFGLHRIQVLLLLPLPDLYLL